MGGQSTIFAQMRRAQWFENVKITGSRNSHYATFFRRLWKSSETHSMLNFKYGLGGSKKHLSENVEAPVFFDWSFTEKNWSTHWWKKKSQFHQKQQEACFLTECRGLFFLVFLPSNQKKVPLGFSACALGTDRKCVTTFICDTSKFSSGTE